jgi:O-antigen/teichoic acid export membrane protein
VLKRIVQNSTYLLTAQSLVKLISFFYTIFLARSLGVSNFGLYITALAYFSLVSSIADLGFNRFLIREGAKDEQKLSQYLALAIFTRLAITAVIFTAFSLWIYIFDKDAQRVSITLFAVMAVLPQAVALTLDAVLVAKQNLKYSSLGLLFMSLATALVGLLLVFSGYGAIGAAAALFVGQLLYVFINLTFVYDQKLKFFTKSNFNNFREILEGSLPYGILGAIGLLSFKIDSIFLSYIKGNYEVGLYGAAYKFLEAAAFVPTAFATALFPAIAKLYIEGPEKIEKIYTKSISVLFSLGVGFTVLYFFILPMIIQFFLPSYMGSIEVIRVLSLAIPFIFVHIPSGQILLSTEKLLKTLIPTYIILFAINVILYLIFIPTYGYMGAASVTVFSEALTFITFFILLKKKVFGVKS